MQVLILVAFAPYYSAFEIMRVLKCLLTAVFASIFVKLFVSFETLGYVARKSVVAKHYLFKDATADTRWLRFG